MSDVTHILQRVEQGDPQAAEELLPLVYDELRKLAAAKMIHESAHHTLQATALVHEAWLRLAGNNARMPFANRGHFFAAAADAMRRILIDRARRKGAGKRGGNPERIDLDKVDVATEADDDTVLLISEALDKLAQQEPKVAELVKLRFFGGLTLAEAGEVLGFTERTAKRYWAFARAWLFAELQGTLGG